MADEQPVVREAPLRPGGEQSRIALVLATSAGGVGRHVHAVASGLAQAGCRVAVFGPAATDRTFGFSAQPGVAFRAVEIASGWRPLEDLRAAWRLHRLVRDAHVVHAHGLRAAGVAALALCRWPGGLFPCLVRGGRSGGARRGPSRRPGFVVTLHNAMLGRTFRRRLLGFVMRRLAQTTDLTLVVSADLATGLGSHVRRIERALVASALPPSSQDGAAVRAGLGLPAGAPVVLAVGRLHLQKGFDVLVEAAAIVATRVPGVVVLIAGEGPQRAALTQQIAASGADVRLLGHRADVSELVHAADVVVMASRWEGWPLAAAEVLGAGRPLVATKTGGLPELVGDAAVLVETGDAGALGTAISNVLTDGRLARDLAERAGRRARQLPTADDVTAQLLSCYQQVSSGRG